jgi:lipoyl(octanoyl) transferase
VDTDLETRTAWTAETDAPTVRTARTVRPALTDARTSRTVRTDARNVDPGTGLDVRWLGRIDYREAWALQKRLVDARVADEIPDTLLLLEHPAVLTLGRGADERHVRASPAELAARGIELIRVERGGEVTYHGPGQLVAYPILSLNRRGLMLRPLVRALEAALADTCRAHGVDAGRRDGHPGCWVDPEGPSPRKIGALGLRVERGVSYHGIALNVSVDLRDFGLIDPCGMPEVESTSIARELGHPEEPPSIESVERAAGIFAEALRARLSMAPAVDLVDPTDPVASADPATVADPPSTLIGAR